MNYSDVKKKRTQLELTAAEPVVGQEKRETV